MDKENWFVLTEIDGTYKAEILKGFFEAQGIQVILSQEGAGQSAFAATVGALGRVQILVPEGQRIEAEKLLAEIDAGSFEEGTQDNE